MLTLLLLLFPSQLALHFWPSWSLINGVRSDYLSPTLYLTDLLIFGLMIFNRLKFKISLWIILIAALNILFSVSPLVSMYKWVRIYEYFWLYKYLINKNIFSLRWAVFWTSILAIAQFILQHSVGGLTYWLGERTFNLYTPGISRIAAFGQLLLRPYATLPHPNALGGFLLIAALILIKSHKRFAILALITIPLTFSKAAILTELCVLIYWLVKKYKNKLFYLLFLLPVFLYSYLPTSSDSVSERIYLAHQSLQIISTHPIFGVGLGNFVSQVPTIRQPVHNIFLLIISELGIPVSILLLYKVAKEFKYWHLVLIVILALGLVDHYWVTLQQNILLLVLVLAMLKSNHDHSL